MGIPSRPHKIFAGLRYWDLSVTADDVLPLGADPDWVDPLIGAMSSYSVNKKLSASLYADIGGFGIGDASHFTWAGMASLEYKFNDSVSVNGGYRYLRADQRDQIDADIEIKGPIVGLILTL